MTTEQLPLLPTQRDYPLDPPPELQTFRTERPVCKIRTPRGDEAWLITRIKDIRLVLTDRRFSSDPKTPGFPSYLTGNIPAPPGFFLQADAPDHTRLRKAVTREFLIDHVQALRPRMQSICDGAIDHLLTLTPPVDLVANLAMPIAARVICQLLGVHESNHEFVKTRTDTVLDRSRSPKEQETAAIELMQFFDGVITEKEATPTDDLLGRLVVEAQKEGQPSHQELVGLAALLLLSGYDTMAHAISLGTITLRENPEQLELVLSNPDAQRSLTDELVRYLSLNHAGLPRGVLADVEVGGQQLRAGDGVLVMLNAGNRDESAFAEPNRFDIEKNATRQHVGFGHGLHKCLGAHFARAEIEIVLPTLFRRIPTLQVAQPLSALAFRDEMVLYGLHELAVTW